MSDYNKVMFCIKHNKIKKIKSLLVKNKNFNNIQFDHFFKESLNLKNNEVSKSILSSAPLNYDLYLCFVCSSLTYKNGYLVYELSKYSPLFNNLKNKDKSIYLEAIKNIEKEHLKEKIKNFN